MRMPNKPRRWEYTSYAVMLSTLFKPPIFSLFFSKNVIHKATSTNHPRSVLFFFGPFRTLNCPSQGRNLNLVIMIVHFVDTGTGTSLYNVLKFQSSHASYICCVTRAFLWTFYCTACFFVWIVCIDHECMWERIYCQFEIVKVTASFQFRFFSTKF
jgi:hypothetical protein